MLRSSIYVAGVLAISAAAVAQKQTLRSFQRVTVPIKDAGVYHVATGTWTRQASESPSSSALVGGTMDTIYACTSNSGYFAALDPGHIWTASGRIPSTTSPDELWNSSALPDGSRPGSAKGSANSYTVDGFQVGYCTDQAGPTVAMTVAFYEAWLPACTSSLLTAVPQGGPFALAGLPGRGTGVQGCWLVTIDLTATTQSFAMQADGDGVGPAAGSGPFVADAFGWTFTFPSITSTLAGTGPLLAGAPSDATGPGTACQPAHPTNGWLQFPPSRTDEASGYDSRKFDDPCGTLGACAPTYPANASSFAWPGTTTTVEAGSDMDGDDAFRIEGGAAPAPGCYFFGGPASGAAPNGPYANYYLELYAKAPANICLPGSAFCAGDGLNPLPSTPCPCGNFGAAGNGCGSSFNLAGANLSAAGSTVADNVVLTITGTNVNPGICVFIAYNTIDPNGLVFGDGITCGTLAAPGAALGRLRGVATVGGAASFPLPPETVTLSQRTSNLIYGSIPLPGSGITTLYGAFYRNAAAAFCPPFTFNGPNNWVITW